MVILSSLKLLSCRSSRVENVIPRDNRSLGVKCPRNRFTTCPKEVIFSQETLIRCAEPCLHVQGVMVFHIGHSGIPTERPRMESNSADMMVIITVFIGFIVTHICCTGFDLIWCGYKIKHGSRWLVAVRWSGSDCGGWRLNFLAWWWGGASRALCAVVSSDARGSLKGHRKYGLGASIYLYRPPGMAIKHCTHGHHHLIACRCILHADT